MHHDELQTDRSVRLAADRLLYDHGFLQDRKLFVVIDQLAARLLSAVQSGRGLRALRGDEDGQRVPREGSSNQPNHVPVLALPANGRTVLRLQAARLTANPEHHRALLHRRLLAVVRPAGHHQCGIVQADV